MEVANLLCSNGHLDRSKCHLTGSPLVLRCLPKVAGMFTLKKLVFKAVVLASLLAHGIMVWDLGSILLFWGSFKEEKKLKLDSDSLSMLPQRSKCSVNRADSNDEI